MLEIKKGPTPRELAVFQGTEGASYDSQGFPREVVYKALLKKYPPHSRDFSHE